MPKYLIMANYTSEGLKGVADKGGSARREAVEKACVDAGGSLESFYFAFGDVDAYVTVDLPDDIAAASLAIAVGAAGMASPTTVKLLTPEEIDRAAATHVAYVPPGG